MSCGCGTKHYIIVTAEGDCAVTDDNDDCVVFTSSGLAYITGRDAGLDDGWGVQKIPPPE